MAEVRSEGFKKFSGENSVSREVAFSNEILRSVVGSTLYGTNTSGSDVDEMGIFVEPPEYVIGFKKMEHYSWREQSEGAKSVPGDSEGILYSLRKFMSLCVQGNPSILLLLYAPDEFLLTDSELGRSVREARSHIVSKWAYPRFRGYMLSQKQRLMGEKRGHMPSRPELVEEFGYDTKYAMHVMRLGLQGVELMETGQITLPMKDREFLVAVRNGLLSFEGALREIENIESRLENSLEGSSLRDSPDLNLINDLLIGWHNQHWSALDAFKGRE